MFIVKLLSQPTLLLLLTFSFLFGVVSQIKAQEIVESISQIPITPESAVWGTIEEENLTPTQSEPILDKINPEFGIYRLDTGDGVNVNVPLFPEFNTNTNLDPEGNIVVPILGRISLVGLSVSEAESKIAYELGTRFLQQTPKVLVSLSATRPAQITVLGEVAKPGFYGFVAGSPISAVIETAGGSTDDADLRSVMIQRTLQDGMVVEQKINLYSALVSGQELPPVVLQGGDTILVSKLQPGEDKNYDRDLVAKSTLPQQEIIVRVLFPSSTGTALRNVPLPNGSSLIDAIAAFPPEDSILINKEIALLRFDGNTNSVVTQELNTKEVINGDLSQNVALRNDDVIVVSRTLLGRVLNTFNVVTQPIRTLIGFERLIDTLVD